MSFVETAHTFSAIDCVRKELTKILSIISIISFIGFSVYYGYLIITNFNNLLYLILYSILFVTILVSFLTEQILKHKSSKSKKEEHINNENNQLIKRIVKIFKYIAKGTIITLAIIELLNQAYLTLSTLFVIFSGLLLIIQILLEVIIYYVCKYIDYFRIAIELDRDSSFALMFTKNTRASKLEQKAAKAQGDSIYTKKEEKIKNILQEKAEEYKAKRKYELNQTIKISKKTIRDAIKENLKEKSKEQIDKMYEKIFVNSQNILSNPIELDNVLLKIKNKLNKLPQDIEVFGYIPTFISIVEYYITNKKTNLSLEFILSIISTIVYIVSPIDIVTDLIPGIGYLDDAYIILKCLDAYEKEFTNFIM